VGYFWRVVERFSTMALVAVLAVAASGVVAAFVHLYGVAAWRGTPYGRTLLGKIALFLLALGMAGGTLLVLSPALRHQARRFVPAVTDAWLCRGARLIRAEALLVLGVVLLAAVLTTLPPAERPAQVMHGAWEKALGDFQLRLTMAPTEAAGSVQFEAYLHHQQGRVLPPETRLFLHLHMLDHDMGTTRVEATPIGVGHYTAPGLISMAGRWQVDVTIQPPSAPPLETVVDFEAATGTLERDRVRRLDLLAALASPLHALSCVLGLLLGALAVFTIWASRRYRLPLWATPFGLLLMVCGGYLCLRVVLVDAYPTAYIRNPIPYEADSVARAHTIFQTHCTVCHGAAGRGDGPVAATLTPKPADLTAAHVDDHTDGDLFWWLTHGIEGTAMPAWEETLSAAERWTVIHYIRALRHSVPGR
jgi:mono/diheme cytochrome c family protein